MSDFEEIKFPALGKLNKDMDKNAMPEHDYPYMLNCIKNETGSFGTITNALGNELISFSLPVGTNEVIDFCEDKEINAGIYFVYNSNNDHCIVRYNSSDDSVEYILDSEPLLGFNLSYRPTNSKVIGSGYEKMLFWNDNNDEPHMIHIFKAYRYTNPTTTTSTTTTT